MFPSLRNVYFDIWPCDRFFAPFRGMFLIGFRFAFELQCRTTYDAEFEASLESHTRGEEVHLGLLGLLRERVSRPTGSEQRRGRNMSSFSHLV